MMCIYWNVGGGGPCDEQRREIVGRYLCHCGAMLVFLWETDGLVRQKVGTW